MVHITDCPLQPNSTTHKTEVCGSSPQWPTRAPVPEELTVRELLVSLLGETGRRMLENRVKTNDQLFAEYYDLVTATLSASYAFESRRVLEKFKASLGDFPPSTQLAISFLTRYRERSDNTRAKYYFILSAFFRWYSGDKLPGKVQVPKILPQYVPMDDIERLMETMRTKQTHKKKIDRDILLVETFTMTGLRRSELAILKVGDLHLDEDPAVLIVHLGKGKKDRIVSLNSYIRDRLSDFTRGKAHEESVFALAPKSISGKIRIWARKAGVPHLHTHSLRHYVGTTLFERGANPRAVQTALGHESLDVTMRYANIIGRDIKDTMKLLDEEKPDQTIKEIRKRQAIV